MRTRSLSSVVMLAGLAAVLLLPSVAIGADSSAYEAAKSMNGSTALSTIATAIEQKLAAMQGSAGLRNIGVTLVAFFALANAIYYLIKGYLAGTGLNGVMADFVGLAILGGTTQIFMDRDIGNAILGTMNTITTAISGGAGASISQLMNDSAVETFETMRNMWNVGMVTWSDGNWWNLVTALPSLMLKIAAMAVTSFLILLALCVYFATLITSQVSINIALILAPVFVPFLLFSPASFLFDGWLKFTIGAGLMKVVGLIMVQITGVILATLAGLSTQAKVDASRGAVGGLEALGIDVVLYCAMILMAAICAYMMLQVPAIATGLVSGSGGAAGFKGWSEIASKSMATKGVTGGMEAPRAGASQGGGAAKGQVAYGGSGLARLAPNALKPAVAAGGRAAANLKGSLLAAHHHKAGAKSESREVQFDVKGRMSQAAEAAYRRTFERRNQREVERGSKPVVVTRPVSSMDKKS
ncbi:MAG: type IV secretion system protein [Vicinamibacterales bacterium]